MIQLHAKHTLGESGDESTSGNTDVIRDASEIYQFSPKGSAKYSWILRRGGAVNPT